MSQFELVEDYLTNRLDDGARSEFEFQMQTDSQLRSEVDMQRGIIEGVKSARAAELKAMLNNVPIGGASSAITGKIALATISAGIIGTALYFGIRSTPAEQIQTLPTESFIEEPIPSESDLVDDIIKTEEDKAPQSTIAQKPAKEVLDNNKPKVTSPQIEVMDLTEDMSANTEDSSVPKPVEKPRISASSVEVEMDNTSKTYSFHYQFREDKLVLYGPFDSSLYEILEINGSTHTLFLYYRNSYYHLDEREHQIVPLIMIRDNELLHKLESFRNKK